MALGFARGGILIHHHTLVSRISSRTDTRYRLAGPVDLLVCHDHGQH